MKKPIVKYYINGSYHEATVRDIGDLESLKTAVKSDVVSAINSLALGEGTIPGNVQEKIDEILTSIDSVKNDISTGGLNPTQIQELESKLTYLDDGMSAIVDNFRDEIARVELKANTELEESKVEYGKKIDATNTELESAKGNIDKTKADLEIAKKELTNVALNYVEVEKKYDQVSGDLLDKVSSSDFDLTEATVSKNVIQIEKNRKELELKASQESLDNTTGRVTVAEAAIKVNANELAAKVSREEVREEIDKVDKNTANLLKNTRDWSGWTTTSPARVRVLSETYLHCHILEVDVDTAYFEQTIEDLSVGETYTASINVKTANQNTTAIFYADKAYNMTIKPNDTTVTNQWARTYVQFVATANTQTVSFRLKGLVGAVKGYFAAAKVEKSKVNSGWQPHFDDVYEKLIKAETEWKVTADGLGVVSEKTEQIGKDVKANTTELGLLSDRFNLQVKEVQSIGGQVEKNTAQIDVTSKAMLLKVEQSDIDKKVEGMNLDNRNRVLNSDFSRGLEEWVEIDKAYKLTDKEGRKFLSITRTGLTADLPAMATTNKFAIKNKDRLMISTDIIVDSMAAWDVKKPLTVELFDITDKRVAVMEFPIATLKGAIVDGKVTRLHGAYVINREDAVKARVKVSLTRNGSLHFSRISAQVGDIGSTEWGLAPEDDQIIRAKLEAQINLTAKEVELKASKTDVGLLGEKLDKAEASIKVESDRVTTTVEELKKTSDKVVENTASITATATEVKTKLNSAQLETELGKKNYVNHAELTATAEGFKQEVTKVETKVDNQKTGGKNIVTLKSVKTRNGSAFQVDNYKWSFTGTVVPYGGLQWWRTNTIVPNTQYMVQFKILIKSGSVTTVGGHISFGTVVKATIDDKEYTAGQWLSGLQHPFVNNRAYDVKLIVNSSEVIPTVEDANTGLFIEPNRNAAKAHTADVWDFQIKEGTVFSAYNLPIEDIANSVNGLPDYIVSRAQNLVTNGSGALGDTTNFPGSIFDGAEREVGAGSFRYDGRDAVLTTDELIPIDTKRVYSFEYFAKSKLGTSRSYAALTPYDVDKKQITIQQLAGRDWSSIVPPKVYKLTKPLKVGDKEIWLDTVDGIRKDGDSTHWNSLLLWGYKNSFGYEYPVGTYSRLYFGYAWKGTDVDGVAKKITFSKPFDFNNPNATDGIFPVGYELSMTNSGSGFMYPGGHTNIQLPKTFTKYRHLYTLNPAPGSGINGFNSSIAFMRVGWLLNRELSGDQSWINGVTFSDITDANNAQTKADEATTRVSTLEQTSERFKVQVSALETLSQNLDTSNLIQMGDFEGDTVGKAPLLWSGGLVDNNYDKVNPVAEPNKSSKVMKIVGSATTNVGYYGTDYNNQQVKYKVAPGDSFYVEFWTRWTDPVQKGEITFGFRTFDSAGTGLTWLTVQDTKVTTWKKVFGTIVIPANTYYVTPYVSYDRAASATSVVYVDNLKIVKKLSAGQVDSTVATSAQLEVKANEINLEVGKKVSADKIIASFNLTPENAKLTASKIDLTGAVTFSSFAPDAANKVNSAESNAVTANAKATAASNQVDNWKRPGTTLIDGGNIYADTLKVNSLSSLSSNLGNVTAGNIKGVNIEGSKIVNVFGDGDVNTNRYQGTTTIEKSMVQILSAHKFSPDRILRITMNQEGFEVQETNQGGLITNYGRFAGASITLASSISQSVIQDSISGLEIISPGVLFNNGGSNTGIFGNQWRAGAGSQNMYINPTNNGSLMVKGTDHTGPFRPVLASAFTVNSERSQKTNIESYNDGLKLIDGLKIRSYNRIDELRSGNKKREIGLILDEAPAEFSGEQGINLYPAVSAALNAIQQLHQISKNNAFDIREVKEAQVVLSARLDLIEKAVNK